MAQGVRMDLFTGTAILISLGAFYWYLTRYSHYWRDRDVPYVPPIPILGNLKRLLLLQSSPGRFLGELYNSVHAVGHRFLGIFLLGCEPALLVRDAELARRILARDFDHFHNRNVECCPGSDRIGYHNLFVVRDGKWKYLRTKLSPTFTSGKLKQMFLVIKDVGSDLTGVIAEIGGRSGEGPAPIECKDLIGKYTTDVINACAFGIRSNSLRDPNSRFRYFGKKIFYTGIKRSIETRSFFFMHWLVKTFRFVFFEKESSKFMAQVFGEILSEREMGAGSRNDFVDVLVKLKKDLEQEDKTGELRERRPDNGCLRASSTFGLLKRFLTDGLVAAWHPHGQMLGLGNVTLGGPSLRRLYLQELELDDESVIAQAALFYTAGFETTSETIMMTLYELSLQPDIQDRLREEVLQTLAKSDGDLTYEDLFQMKYLDMVVSETLRKYPPMPFIDRICTKTYQIPDSDVKIKKGTPVFIALYKGLHYDSRYFPNPEKYDPERFGDAEKSRIQPYSYLPFGEGPHTCLGKRFGLMNAKTTLALILSKFKVEACEKTRIPMEFSERAIILGPKHELFLVFSPL